MKCLDSGHDSSLLCGSVLRTRYEIWEAHSLYLLRRLAATILGQCCFQGQIFRCLWVHMAQRIAWVPPADSFCPLVWWNTWSPIHSRKDTLHLSPFSSMLYVSLYDTFCTHAVWTFYNIPCWGFTKWKASVSTCQTGFLLLQGAQLPGQLSSTAHHFSGFLRRTLFLSASHILLSRPLQAPFYPGTRAGSLCLLALERFPFWCCDLPSQALYDRSCTTESTARKRKMQTWNKSKLLIKPHSGHGKQVVISFIEGWGNWGSLPRSCCGRC